MSLTKAPCCGMEHVCHVDDAQQLREAHAALRARIEALMDDPDMYWTHDNYVAVRHLRAALAEQGASAYRDLADTLRRVEALLPSEHEEEGGVLVRPADLREALSGQGGG